MEELMRFLAGPFHISVGGAMLWVAVALFIAYMIGRAILDLTRAVVGLRGLVADGNKERVVLHRAEWRQMKRIRRKLRRLQYGPALTETAPDKPHTHTYRFANFDSLGIPATAPDDLPADPGLKTVNMEIQKYLDIRRLFGNLHSALGMICTHTNPGEYINQKRDDFRALVEEAREMSGVLGYGGGSCPIKRNTPPATDPAPPADALRDYDLVLGWGLKGWDVLKSGKGVTADRIAVVDLGLLKIVLEAAEDMYQQIRKLDQLGINNVVADRLGQALAEFDSIPLLQVPVDNPPPADYQEQTLPLPPDIADVAGRPVAPMPPNVVISPADIYPPLGAAP